MWVYTVCLHYSVQLFHINLFFVFNLRLMMVRLSSFYLGDLEPIFFGLHWTLYDNKSTFLWYFTQVPKYCNE